MSSDIDPLFTSKRNLDNYCFTENFQSHVLLQVRASFKGDSSPVAEIAEIDLDFHVSTSERWVDICNSVVTA